MKSCWHIAGYTMYKNTRVETQLAKVDVWFLGVLNY